MRAVLGSGFTLAGEDRTRTDMTTYQEAVNSASHRNISAWRDKLYQTVEDRRFTIYPNSGQRENQYEQALLIGLDT